MGRRREGMANIVESGRFPLVRKEFVILLVIAFLGKVCWFLIATQPLCFSVLGLFTCFLHDSAKSNLRNEGVRMKRCVALIIERSKFQCLFESHPGQCFSLSSCVGPLPFEGLTLRRNKLGISKHCNLYP